MNRRLTIISLAASLTGAVLAACSSSQVKENKLEKPMVIEIVTLKLKDGISYSEFSPIDKAVKVEHVSKQPGFVSRQSAAGQNGEWLVIVHWRSEEDADASMASFTSAPAAKKFMDMIDPTTMVMKRYTPI